MKLQAFIFLEKVIAICLGVAGAAGSRSLDDWEIEGQDTEPLAENCHSQ